MEVRACCRGSYLRSHGLTTAARAPSIGLSSGISQGCVRPACLDRPRLSFYTI